MKTGRKMLELPDQAGSCARQARKLADHRGRQEDCCAPRQVRDAPRRVPTGRHQQIPQVAHEGNRPRRGSRLTPARGRELIQSPLEISNLAAVEGFELKRDST